MSTIVTTIDPERQMLGDVEMVGRERWEEIHRRANSGASIRAVAGALDLDRKTVRRGLRQTAWMPYERAARSDTLVSTHAEYLRRRAADVGYSAHVLFQELRRRQYTGSYETVKRFVRPIQPFAPIPQHSYPVEAARFPPRFRRRKRRPHGSQASSLSISIHDDRDWQEWLTSSGKSS